MRIISRKEAIKQGLDRYFTGKPCKHGHIAERYVKKSTCLICNKERHVIYRNRNREYLNQKSRQKYKNNKEYWANYYQDHKEEKIEDQRQKNQKQKREDPQQYWKDKSYHRAKRRAKEKNIEFNLTKEDIPEIPRKCPYLDIGIFMADDFYTSNSPALDRIDNSKGYTKDNIIVVSQRANWLKNNATLEELERLVFGVRRTIENQFVDYGAYI